MKNKPTCTEVTLVFVTLPLLTSCSCDVVEDIRYMECVADVQPFGRGYLVLVKDKQITARKFNKLLSEELRCPR
jgi:hypothetical protein